MIQIVTSRGTNLWSQAAQALQASYEKGRSVLLLVPEQYTLQAERDALDILRAKGFFRLQVLSPSRLMTRVFDRLGRDARSVIDERGQNLTLARALWQHKDDLQYYASSKNMPGFTSKLTEAFNELKSAGLTPDTLADWLNQQEHPSPKFSDLATLFTAYEEAMAGQLIDSEDIQRDFLTRLKEGAPFAGWDVIVHGFDLLTPPLIRVLAILGAQADSLLITMVTETPGAADGPAFSVVEHSIQQLKDACQEQGMDCGITRLPAQKNSAPEALNHLQQNLLAHKQQPYTGVIKGLRLYAGKTPHEEIRRAAQQIHEELAKGADPRGIAVYLTQDSYARMLSDIFTSYGIPHFVAMKEAILAQPLVRTLQDALACVQSASWRPQDVFSYLKSPYSPLTPDQAFALENYARAYGIRGSLWQKSFARGDETDREAMEALRQAAISPVIRLRDGLNKARDTQASLDAVLRFLEDIQASERVLRINEQLLGIALPDQAQRASQVWEKLMGLFEQMKQLLGDQRVPLGRFAQWLTAGLSQTSLSTLPPLQHSVQVGVLGQLMVRQPHSVYLLGLNSGALSVREETLLMDNERVMLEQELRTQMNLQQGEREQIRLLDLWKAIALARDSVHLSYALSDDQGKAMAPVIELLRVKRMFPQLIEEGGAVGSEREACPFTPRSALDEIALRLSQKQMDSAWWKAWDWLGKAPEWQPFTRGIQDALVGDQPVKRLEGATAKALHTSGVMSVSRLESFAGCPFKHFVDYGLKPQERREWALQSIDLGNFCHAAMEGFTDRMLKDPEAFHSMSREGSALVMDEVLQTLTEGWEDAPWADTPRAKQNARHTKNICRRMAWSLTESRQHSDFETVETELNFGMKDGLPAIEIELEDGSVLRLRGTIDRLDTAVLDGDLTLLRIVDYKTGHNDLTGGDLEKGVQLQLMLYLKAALKLVDKPVPAAAVYQRMMDPLPRADSEQEAIKESRKQLRMNGPLLADARVLEKLDSAQPPLTLATYIKKDGELKESGRLLTQEEMASLMDLAEQKTRDLAKDIFTGLINRSPLVRSSGRAECAFCAYQGICRTEKIGKEALRRTSRKISLKALAREQLEGRPAL